MSLKQERVTLRTMIRLFCARQHRADPRCGHCLEVLEYAEQRLAKCPFGEKKPACQECDIHCYTPEMRRRMVEIMQFSGPRMIFHRPIMAFRHLLRTLRSKK